MGTLSRPRASFGTTRKYIPGVLERANTMYSSIQANIAMFASLPISMVAFLALITALTLSQQATTGTKAKGSATLRNTKRDALWTAMQTLLMYVQSLADAMTAENAASVIQAAGLVVAGTGTHAKAVLTAALTAASGTVHLEANRGVLVGTANAHKHVTFNWQLSIDGGKTWQTATSTPLAHADIPGLTLLTVYSFRVSVTIDNVPGAWSQAVSLLVH